MLRRQAISTLFPYTTLFRSLPGYEEVGKRRVLLGCWGSFNDPKVCDYTYRNMDEWGKAMYVTPGVIERAPARSEEHTSESSHRCISYAVFCLKKKNEKKKTY